MSEKLGSALFELRTDDSDFSKGIDQAESRVKRLQRDFNETGVALRKSGRNLSLAVTAPLALMGKGALDAAVQYREAGAQVEAALTSMGGASGKTVDELKAAADQLETLSSFDDAEILQKVTANLLTFGNVAGNEFDRAQQAAVDLSARLGQDLQSSTVMLGKALNDPIAGITAMTRVGVSFTEEQKNMIKAMAEAGDIAGAQGLILEELEKQYGGAAQAARDAAPGGDLNQQWRDLQQTIGERLVGALGALERVLAPIIAGFNGLSPEMQTTIVVIAGLAAAIGPVLIMLGLMASGIGSIIAIAPAVATALGLIKVAMLGLLANPVLLAAAAVIAAIFLAWQNWDKIKPIIDQVGTAITEWWNDNVAPILEAVMEKVRAVADFFRDYFGAQIEGVVNVISALMRGDFAGAWSAAKEAVQKSIEAALRVIDTLAPGAIAAVKAMYEGVKTWLQDKLGAVFEWVQDKIRAVEKTFGWLYDRVVGNSWIPDLVRDVGAEMDKLDASMVKPAVDAAEAVDAAFAGIKSPVIEGQVGFGGGFPALDGGEVPDNQTGQQISERMGQFFSDGIKAAMDGNLGGFLKSWLSRLGDSLIGSLGQSLSNSLSGLSGLSGGGLLSGLISAFAGFFANGGTIPTGQFGIVGEQGPEIAFATAGGVGILPNSSLSTTSPGAARAEGGGVSVSITIPIDATGADPAAIERLRSQLSRLEAELPGRIVSTVQDAKDRRILNIGGAR